MSFILSGWLHLSLIILQLTDLLKDSLLTNSPGTHTPGSQPESPWEGIVRVEEEHKRMVLHKGGHLELWEVMEAIKIMRQMIDQFLQGKGRGTS